MMKRLPEYVNGLPNLSGAEAEIAALISSTHSRPVFTDGVTSFGELNSACAIALHMHQPLIPAGGEDLRTAEIIGNLQYMTEHPGIGDNHNAGVFRRCYKRMAEFVPQLVHDHHVHMDGGAGPTTSPGSAATTTCFSPWSARALPSPAR